MSSISTPQNLAGISRSSGYFLPCLSWVLWIWTHYSCKWVVNWGWLNNRNILICGWNTPLKGVENMFMSTFWSAKWNILIPIVVRLSINFLLSISLAVSGAGCVQLSSLHAGSCGWWWLGMCLSISSDYLLLVPAARIRGYSCSHTHADPAGKHNCHCVAGVLISGPRDPISRSSPSYNLYICWIVRLLWMLGIKSHVLLVHVNGSAPLKFRLSLTSCWGSPQRSCLSGRLRVCMFII